MLLLDRWGGGAARGACRMRARQRQDPMRAPASSHAHTAAHACARVVSHALAAADWANFAVLGKPAFSPAPARVSI